MNKLQAGFSRADITPELGAPIGGYTLARYREGGYESRSSLFAPGVAERIIEGGLSLAEELK